MPVIAKDLKTISLFSGIGGLDLGASFAGLHPLVAVDHDNAALSTLGRALEVPTLCCADISCLDPLQLLEAGKIKNATDLLIIGGPPCTAFSHAGFWIEKKRNGTDHQTGRIADFLRFVRIIRPRAFVLENVPGLLFKTYHHFFENFISSAKNEGYTISYAILNAADYGVPQKRRRLFVVGILGNEAPFEFPKPCFSGKHRSAAWAFLGLTAKANQPESDELLSGKYRDLLPAIPPGGNYLFYTARRGSSHALFEWRSKYWSFLLKLHPEQPSPTLPALRVTNNGPFHWEGRHLRIREIARLQSFPDNFLLDDIVAGRRYLGNAVPPLLAAQLFVALRAQLGMGFDPHCAQRLEEALNPLAPYSVVQEALSSALSLSPVAPVSI
jgi:DNA (cytosine-5)-methyltransferase 1